MSVMMLQTKCKLNNVELFVKLFYSKQRNWKRKVLRRKQRELEKLSESSPEYIYVRKEKTHG